LWALMSI